MNIEPEHNIAFDHQEDLIFIIAEVLADDCGINIDDNCTISEMANLLEEIENHFDGDNARALAAIRAGELKFDEVPYSDPKFGSWLEWHIAPTRQ
jgi:hypothetical protein